MAPYHILIPMFFPIFPENLVLLTESEQFGPKSAHICPTNIATRKMKNIDRMTELKKARKMLPRVAVHRGKA